MRALTPILVLLLPSCANLSMSRSGFLDDYEQLENAPEHEVTFIPDEVDLWISDEGHAFDSVYVEEITYLEPDETKHVPDAEGRARLEHVFGNYLRRHLGESFEVVEEPRPSSAIVRAAITDVNPSSVWINVVGVILAVPFDMGGISGEMEIRTADGDPVVAMTAVRDGTPFLVFECFQQYGHAYHGMQKWSKVLKEILDASARDPEPLAYESPGPGVAVAPAQPK